MNDQVWERTCEHHWDEPDTKSTYCVTCGIPYWAYEWIEELKEQLDQQAKDTERYKSLLLLLTQKLGICPNKRFDDNCRECKWYDFCRLRAEGDGR